MEVPDDWKLSIKASDWCSAWPDSWRSYDLSGCCHRHDNDYADPRVSRWVADVRLLGCVSRECNLLMGMVMFIGVRCAGWLFKHYIPLGGRAAGPSPYST
jgi:hypothetical protein